MNTKLSLSTRGLRMIALILVITCNIVDEVLAIAGHFKRRILG